MFHLLTSLLLLMTLAEMEPRLAGQQGTGPGWRSVGSVKSE